MLRISSQSDIERVLATSMSGREIAGAEGTEKC